MKSKEILPEWQRLNDESVEELGVDKIVQYHYALIAAEEEVEEWSKKEYFITIDGSNTINQLVADNSILKSENKELKEKLEDMRKYLDS